MLQRISGLILVCLCAASVWAQAISSGDLEKLSRRPNYNGSPVYGWITIAPVGEKFTIEMPNEAQSISFTNGPPNIPRNYLYADVTSKSLFNVLAGARPSVQDAKTRRKRLRTEAELVGEINQFLLQLANSYPRPDKVPAPLRLDLEGKKTEKEQSFYQYRLTDAAGMGIMRFYLTADSFYFITVISPNYNEADKFFSSFTLGKPNQDAAKSNVKITKFELEKTGY